MLPFSWRRTVGLSLRIEARLPDGLDGDTEGFCHIIVVKALAHAIYGFSELHVYIPVDKTPNVYNNIYVLAK